MNKQKNNLTLHRAQQRQIIRRYLKTYNNSDNPLDFWITYYTLIHNFLHLEDIFEKEVKIAGKLFGDHLDLPDTTDKKIIDSIAIDLYDVYNHVRFAVETYDSIEEVRLAMKKLRYLKIDIYNKIHGDLKKHLLK